MHFGTVCAVSALGWIGSDDDIAAEKLVGYTLI